ncbi:MAG TPA: thiamine-phosphate kinase [Candidatus Nitrosotalea sp.]|nr:thiamine-phosphate kinase [Candidatus Nitrosotalea sp.]
MTEDEIVAAITALCPGNKLIVGIGDDAAIWQPSRSHRSAISTDMLVEGVDFTSDAMSLEDAGWRAMAANLSDLAAMGARPVLATVALGFPQTTAIEKVLELYRGLTACAAAYRITIAGGDLSRSGAITIAITVIGEVRSSNVKTRSDGRPGDVLAVTAPLGSARAGLELTRGELRVSKELAADALQAFRRPSPRVAEGRFFASSRNVDALIDISDGLATDTGRLAEASECGAVVEDVPVAAPAVAVAAALGEEPERFALAGGEDFELLVAIRPRAFKHLANRYAARFGRELLRIGSLRAQPGVIRNGTPLERSGWDHFEPVRQAPER